MQFSYDVTLRDDRESVAIRFPTEIDVSAVELDELIAGLARVRSQMRPAYPNDAPPIDNRHLVNDPRWHGTWSTDKQTVELQIQHPGFGWLPYTLPRQEAAKLGSFLETAAGVEGGTPHGKPN